MEGRAIARPNFVKRPKQIRYLNLQWRAGQLPGRTPGRVVEMAAGGPPSMEGRAIARPNWHDVRPIPGCCAPSMEGRAIARPNLSMAIEYPRTVDPSMEGRAIARPNPASWASPPAAPVFLQWRAGQLPGRTAPVRSRGAVAVLPSMEGRAIARPNPPRPARHDRAPLPSMEGRAIARPNFERHERRSSPNSLQWRAGQLPGRTGG